eukprot:403354689
MKLQQQKYNKFSQEQDDIESPAVQLLLLSPNTHRIQSLSKSVVQSPRNYDQKKQTQQNQENLKQLRQSLDLITHREALLKEKLQRFDKKLNSPSKYFSIIIDESNQKQATHRIVVQQAKQLMHQKKTEMNRQGMIKLKKQLEVLESEIDSVKMPIIETFKANILKQRGNAFKRTIKGSVERSIQEEVMLPQLCKQVQRKIQKGNPLISLQQVPTISITTKLQ